MPTFHLTGCDSRQAFQNPTHQSFHRFQTCCAVLTPSRPPRYADCGLGLAWPASQPSRPRRLAVAATERWRRQRSRRGSGWSGRTAPPGTVAECRKLALVGAARSFAARYDRRRLALAARRWRRRVTSGQGLHGPARCAGWLARTGTRGNLCHHRRRHRRHVRWSALTNAEHTEPPRPSDHNPAAVQPTVTAKASRGAPRCGSLSGNWPPRWP